MAKDSITKSMGSTNIDYDTKKSWLASAMSIKDSHLGECLLSTNAREHRRLNSVLQRLERQHKENLRMMRIQKWTFIRRSYVLRHQPIDRSNTENSNQNTQLLLNQTSPSYRPNKGSFFTRNGVESCSKQLSK